MIRTCLYTRISTDEENQPTSLASQHERLEAFCKVQEDWRIIAHHEDRATGTKLERPGLQAALDLARQGRIDQLLVYRIDRLSRKVRQLAGIAEELDNLGVILRSATEPFDTGSAAGRMMLQMLGVFAEFEHATIVDRVTSGIERRAREGRWPNGRIPFGYERNERKELVPDERTAPVIRRIFKWYADRKARRRRHRPPPRCRTRACAAARLAARSRAVDSRQPGVCRARSLARADIPRNPRAANRPGHLRPRTGIVERARGGLVAARLKPRGLPALRAVALWTLPPRLRRHVREGKRRHLPLLRLLRPTEARPQGLRRRAATKGQAGGRDPRPANQALPARRPHPRRDQQAAASSGTDRAQLTEQRASLAKEITRAERAIERYQDAFENGALDPARFKERLSALDTRLDALRAQDQAFARELAADTPTTPDTAALHAVADHLAHVIANGDPDQTKALLRILIADLRVNGRAEILPTYRVGAPVVCAQTSSVEPAGIEPATSCLQSRRSPS